MTGTDRLRKVVILICFSCMLLAGCHGQSADIRKTSVVTGKVTFESRPVRIGKILFYSSDGEHAGRGTIDPMGNYKATDVPVGTVKVAFAFPELPIYMKIDPSKAAQLPPAMTPPTSKEHRRYQKLLESIKHIPDRYKDKSKSKIAVEVGEKPQVFNVELSR